MSSFFLRFLDVILASFFLVSVFPIIILLLVFCYFDTGSPIFSQCRVGKNLKVFKLYKFRSMKIGTRHMPTHEAAVSDITRFGGFLRKTKLDELPQFINVLKGDMSIVGPRPCLESQIDLIELRKYKNIYKFKPGITGIAQIKNIDMENPKQLVQYEYDMIVNFGIYKYIMIIFKTVNLVLIRLYKRS